MVLLRSKR